MGSVGYNIGGERPKYAFGYGGGSGYGGNGFGGLGLEQYMDYFRSKTVPESVAEMNQGEAALPASIQLAAATAAADPGAAMAHFMATQGNQMIGQATADAASHGRGNSTFGAADVAFSRQAAAQGAYAAGQDAIDRAMNRWKTQRSQYVEGLGGLVNRDSGAAQAANFALGAGRLQMDRDQFNYKQKMDGNDPEGESKFAPWANLAMQAGPSLLRGFGGLVKSGLGMGTASGGGGRKVAGGASAGGAGAGGQASPTGYSYHLPGVSGFGGNDFSAPSGKAFGLAPGGIGIGNSTHTWSY